MMAGGSIPLDPDAQAFLTAAGITTPSIIFAINTLVLNLKGYGLWTKMNAIYPFVGGTATTHKYNLKDPQDTNAAFRLVFVGGWTHSATGALPNGTNGYANTFLNDNILNVNDKSLSYYSRTNNPLAVTFKLEMGVIGTYRSNLAINRTYGGQGNDFLAVSDISTSAIVGGAVSPVRNTSLGFYLANRISNVNNQIFANGISVGLNTTNWGITTAMNISYALGATNNSGTIGGFTDRECAFASIGAGLSPTEAADYYTAVQLFQTALGRQV